jgi:O-antigen ligase
VAGAAGTQSRGGLVALVCCVAAAVVLARGRRLRALGLTLLISTVGAFALATTPGALDRITSFDSGGNGRSDLWTIAWEMFVDHPVQGVGLDQFRVESKEYVREVGNLEAVNLVVEDPHIVHNTYLQLLAETGIIGLALFLLVVLSCMLAAWRAAGAFERAGRRDLQALAQGVLIGQIGILAAAFFLSIGANLKLWLLLGLGPTLLAAARAPGVRPADARATS